MPPQKKRQKMGSERTPSTSISAKATGVKQRPKRYVTKSTGTPGRARPNKQHDTLVRRPINFEDEDGVDSDEEDEDDNVVEDTIIDHDNDGCSSSSVASGAVASAPAQQSPDTGAGIDEDEDEDNHHYFAELAEEASQDNDKGKEEEYDADESEEEDYYSYEEAKEGEEDNNREEDADESEEETDYYEEADEENNNNREVVAVQMVDSREASYLAHRLNRVSDKHLRKSRHNTPEGGLKRAVPKKLKQRPNKKFAKSNGMNRWSRWVSRRGGLWSKQTGIYLTHNKKTDERKAGFIAAEQSCLDGRIENIYQGTNAKVSVKFVNCEGLPRECLLRLETFLKFALFLQPRMVKGKKISCYSSIGEVCQGVGEGKSTEIMDAIFDIISSSQNVKVGVGDFGFLERNSWRDHPMIIPYLYKAGLRARHRHIHPTCRFSTDNTRGQDPWLLQDLWEEFACDFNATCPCMSEAVAAGFVFSGIEDDVVETDGSNDEGSKEDQVDEIDEDDYTDDVHGGGGTISGESDDENESEERQQGDIIPAICGIRNIGNTCYISAILHMFFCQRGLLDEFYTLLEEAEELPLIRAIIEIASNIGRFEIFHDTTHVEIGNPREVKDLVSSNHPRFANTNQHDVFELLDAVITQIDGELGGTTFSDRFNSNLRTTYTCTRCGRERDPISDEVFPIKVNLHGANNVVDCFRNFCADETVDDHQCPYCEQRLQSIKRKRFLSSSDFLIVQLKRFVVNSDGETQKDNTEIMLEESLSLAPGFFGKSDGTGRYKLRGIVNHIGPNPESGHYIAYVRNGDGDENEWLLFDDENGSIVPFDAVAATGKQFYLALYEWSEDPV